MRHGITWCTGRNSHLVIQIFPYEKGYAIKLRECIQNDSANLNLYDKASSSPK